MTAAGRKPFDFQRATWRAFAEGRSGLVHAPTGMGKTWAVWLATVSDWMRRELPRGWTAVEPAAAVEPESARARSRRRAASAPVQALWLTPLKSLASDVTRALREPVEALGLPWSVERRTGDTAQSLKAKQRDRLPTALVTTPESLSLLLSYPGSAARFASLRAVVVDEWHELLSTKRGVQVELALARLRRLRPGLRVWGLSATLGNLDEALAALVGEVGTVSAGAESTGRDPVAGAEPVLIHSPRRKRIEIRTLIPATVERFPWYGHLGVKLVDAVAEAIASARSTLVFCNTRSQAELWFQALLRDRPELLGRLALHHGSLDLEIRRRVESMLSAGELSAVVCTSSLDLGVDFEPVDQVMQLGSPKGIARLMQRAGRSGHQPGRVSRAVCVPTHAFELIEFAAARQAVARRDVEARPPLRLTMDVLAQHLVTLAAGDGFTDDLFDEVRRTHAFAELTREQWGWVLDFVTRGGPALQRYEAYRKVERRDDGVFVAASPRLARQHRAAIGTITGDATMVVRFGSGRKLGQIEESFIGRLRPGDRFIFAGRWLELVRVRQMAATVRPATRKKGTVPRWAGSRFPLSTLLARDVRRLLDAAREGRYASPEMKAVRPLLELQQRMSMIPASDDLLLEHARSREGRHYFLYPFGGRLVHEGLASLLAHRLTAAQPLSVTVTANDYGLELLSPRELPTDEAFWRPLLSPDGLLDDLVHCLNGAQLARRYFRDVARIAGLIVVGYPGEARSQRHLQASSELIFDVLSEFDPDNLLLDQARREVLAKQLEIGRLRSLMASLEGKVWRAVATPRLSPMAFPLYADRLRAEHVSSEAWRDRMRRMVDAMEADDEPGDAARVE